MPNAEQHRAMWQRIRLACRLSGCDRVIHIFDDEPLRQRWRVRHGENEEHVLFIDYKDYFGAEALIADWLKRIHEPPVWEQDE